MKVSPRLRQVLLSSALIVLTAASAGCSVAFGGSPEAIAAEVIETRLTSVYGLEGGSATCQEPPDQNPGATFACSAETSLGRIEWGAVIGDDKTVDVQPMNLLDAATVVSLETSAAQLLGEEVGLVLAGDAFDCGDVIVLNPDQVVACSVVDPTSGDVYDATMRITDAAANAFTVEVADQPR